jgi:hypothetical protein
MPKNMIKILVPAIIASTCLISNPMSAAPERYPTNSEIKTIRQKFLQRIAKMKSDKVGSSLIRDRRSAKERQAMNLFVKSWSRVDPSIASFLGSWSGDWLFYIYPSKKSQKVCVLSLDEGHLSFEGAFSIHNGIIRRGGGQVILREGLYLGTGSIQNGKPEYSDQIPFGSPTLPPSITEVVNSSREEEGKKDSIRQRFKENGCITGTLN